MEALNRLLGRGNGEAENAEPIVPEVVTPLNATLLSHVNTSKVTRLELASLPVPEATDTFRPIPHSTLIDKLEEALSFRHISITRDEYAVSKDGMRMFGLIEVNADYEGVRFGIGLRNANDRSMRVGMVAGFRVFVCDNLSLSGDFQAILAKHSKHYDLIESLTIGVDRLQRAWDPLKRTIDAKRNLELDDDHARSIIYRGFMTQKFPVKLLRAVDREYFVAPSYDEFKSRTLWSLENSFTTAFKQLRPIQQFQATAKLGRFLKPFTQN